MTTRIFGLPCKKPFRAFSLAPIYQHLTRKFRREVTYLVMFVRFARNSLLLYLYVALGTWVLLLNADSRGIVVTSV